MASSVVSFEPLYPEDRMLEPLLERASRLIELSQKLIPMTETPMARALIPQLRAMNSYYTNKIEGQHTTPAKIEAALNRHYAVDDAERKKQLFAMAHIEAESTLEQDWAGLTVSALFEPERISVLHDRFFAFLPAEDRFTGEGEAILPGEIRQSDVTVGRHLAPRPELIEPLLNAWATRYARIRGREYQLIGIACSHHRLTWIHPFVDGNGRVARLHSHLALRAAALTHGLWSPLRGLARSHAEYYARLSAADQSRRNDLDGRGNLSQEGLVQFVEFFLDCCIDQAEFMVRMTDFDGITERTKDLLHYLEAHPWALGSEKSVIKADAAVLPMEFVMRTRAATRAEFGQMLGNVSDVNKRRIVRSLQDFGLLDAPTHRGDLTFSLPLRSLRFLFPKLWPEVDQE
ncbi:Fic family protein [Robbsia sp. KACC 23696]|uniref:Fic family protein n=1 Tax=Robbsia sp. KACC 23696 TaxID=3149231 RepID=UPI00325BFE39